MAAACTMRRPWGALLLLLLLGALLCAHGKRPACKVCPGTLKRPPIRDPPRLPNLEEGIYSGPQLRAGPGRVAKSRGVL